MQATRINGTGNRTPTRTEPPGCALRIRLFLPPSLSFHHSPDIETEYSNTRLPDNTLYGWVRAAKLGHLNVGTGYRTPEDNLNLAEENAQLRKQLKEQEKEIKRLNELNEFLEEASAFFAASRRRSGKPNE